MALSPKQRQHAINVACGYGFFAWGMLTLGWIGALVDPTWIGLPWFLALIAGFFGALRAITFPHPRTWVLPVATLVFLGGITPVLIYLGPAMMASIQLAVVISGFGYSVALLPILRRLIRDDFAKAVPAWTCRTCGYTLIGLDRGECPECGTSFDPEKIPDAVRSSGPIKALDE